MQFSKVTNTLIILALLPIFYLYLSLTYHRLSEFIFMSSYSFLLRIFCFEIQKFFAHLVFETLCLMLKEITKQNRPR